MKTALHIIPCNVSACETHNRRLKKLDYIREDLSSLNEQHDFVDHPLQTELAKIKRDVKKQTGRKLQKNANPIKEGVVLIREDTTIEDVKKFCEVIQKKFGLIPLQITTHKDEGHMKEGEWKPNFHAHVVWRVYGENGRNLSPTPLQCSEMQDIAAEVFGMDRGQKSGKKHISAMQFKIQQMEQQISELEKTIAVAVKDRAAIQKQVAEQRILLENLRKSAEQYKIPKSFWKRLNDAIESVKDIENKNALAKAKAELDAEREKHEQEKSYIINHYEDEARFLRNSTDEELKESAYYLKHELTSLKERLIGDADAQSIRGAWNALPSVVEDCKRHALPFSFEQMQQLALGKVISIPEFAGCLLSDIGEHGDVEVSFDPGEKSLVARLANSMKRRGEKVWMKIDQWRARFLETLEQYRHRKISSSEDIKQDKTRGIRR